MLFVLAAVLLLSSPVHARYADGMNSYAAYHVMYGGLDPMGTVSQRIPTFSTESILELDTQQYREVIKDGESESDPGSIRKEPTGQLQSDTWATNKLGNALIALKGGGTAVDDKGFIFIPWDFENKEGLLGQARYGFSVQYNTITLDQDPDRPGCFICNYSQVKVFMKGAVAYDSARNDPRAGHRVYKTDKKQGSIEGQALTPLQHERIHIEGGAINDASGNLLWNNIGAYGGANNTWGTFASDKLGLVRVRRGLAGEEAINFCRGTLALRLINGFFGDKGISQAGEFHSSGGYTEVELGKVNDKEAGDYGR